MKIENFIKLYIGNEVNKKYDLHTPIFCEGDNPYYAIPDIRKEEIYGDYITTNLESLNIQTSKYHKETLLDHIAFVTHEMKYTGYLGITIAILHDIGKKFTVKYNKDGEICYYGHEKISAQLAVDMLTGNEFYTDKDLNIIYPVISQHLQPRLIHDSNALNIYYEGFRAKYGPQALDILKKLNDADRGITTIAKLNSPEVISKIQDGYDIIKSFKALDIKQ